MSGCSDEFVTFVMDQLSGLAGVRDRRMFGAHGLAVDDVNFAILAADSLFLVVDDTTRPKYEQAGMAPFWYTKKTGRVWVRRYHEVPPDVLEDRERLLAWAREAADIARDTRRK